MRSNSLKIAVFEKSEVEMNKKGLYIQEYTPFRDVICFVMPPIKLFLPNDSSNLSGRFRLRHQYPHHQPGYFEGERVDKINLRERASSI